MDLKMLLAGTATEDLDKLMEVLPLLKERADLDKAIAGVLSGKVGVTPPKKPATETPVVAPAKPKRKASRKRAKAKQEQVEKAIVKAPATLPASKAKELTMKDAAIAYMKGRKEATMAELVKAVADAKKIPVNPATHNVISVTIYKCTALKRIGPGRFALA